MDPSQNDHQDLKKELSPPPLQGKGFDDRLRRRIEEQLDRKERRRRKRLWLWPVLGTCGVLAAAAAIWAVPPLGGGASGEPSAAAVSTAAASGLNSDGAAALSAEGEGATATATPAAPPIKTGALIGLRQDHTAESRHPALPGSSYSTYRTLMLAPDNGRVVVAAEGSGILVPYGQKFWKIDALTKQTDTDVIHYLSAHPAEKEAEARDADIRDNPEERMHHSEKLVFAGNQYVSIAEQEDVWRGNAPAQYRRIWVRKLNQMPDSPVTDYADNKTDAVHVTVQDIFGDGARNELSALEAAPKVEGLPSRLTGENWTITRKAGQWTAQVAETFSGMGNKLEDYILREYPAELPALVTSHDEVCCALEQAKKLQPAATDLLSSPLEDMVVVWTAKELIVYSSLQQSGGPLLRVELKPGETLVSAQWATGAYVPLWVDKARKYLQ